MSFNDFYILFTFELFLIISYMKKGNMIDIKEFFTLLLISVLLGSLLGQIVKLLI